MLVVDEQLENAVLVSTVQKNAPPPSVQNLALLHRSKELTTMCAQQPGEKESHFPVVKVTGA